MEDAAKNEKAIAEEVGKKIDATTTTFYAFTNEKLKEIKYSHATLPTSGKRVAPEKLLHLLRNLLSKLHTS